MTVGESEEAQARADSTMGDEENWRVGDAQAAREIEVLQVLQVGDCSPHGVANVGDARAAARKREVLKAWRGANGLIELSRAAAIPERQVQQARAHVLCDRGERD